MTKFKAILFDLDGTLRHNLPSGGEVFVDHARRLGLRISEEDRTRGIIWEHYYFASSPEIKADSETYKGNSAGFWLNFSRRHLVALGTDPSQAAELASKASAYMQEFYKPEAYVPQDAHDLLAFLKDAGYTLGMVSNREKAFHDELKRLNMDSYFHFSLAGGEVNSYKPDRVIFDRALEMAGTPAQEAMYVGDNYFADVVGAQRAGLTPVLYDPAHLFPDAECAVIKSFKEFPELLK